MLKITVIDVQLYILGHWDGVRLRAKKYKARRNLTKKLNMSFPLLREEQVSNGKVPRHDVDNNPIPAIRLGGVWTIEQASSGAYIFEKTTSHYFPTPLASIKKLSLPDIQGIDAMITAQITWLGALEKST